MLRRPFVSTTILALTLGFNAGLNTGCNPLEGKEFAPGGDNQISTNGGGGGGGGDDSEGETPETGDPNGPTLSVDSIEMFNDPQSGPNIKFELQASDPQDDVVGGTLFLTLGGDADLSADYDIREESGNNVALYFEGLVTFAIKDVELEGAYTYELQAKDNAGNTGGAISGDVPPFEG